MNIPAGTDLAHAHYNVLCLRTKRFSAQQQNIISRRLVNPTPPPNLLLA
jgi:hypothetical protein